MKYLILYDNIYVWRIMSNSRKTGVNMYYLKNKELDCALYRGYGYQSNLLFSDKHKKTFIGYFNNTKICDIELIRDESLVIINLDSLVPEATEHQLKNIMKLFLGLHKEEYKNLKLFSLYPLRNLSDLEKKKKLMLKHLNAKVSVIENNKFLIADINDILQNCKNLKKSNSTIRLNSKNCFKCSKINIKDHIIEVENLLNKFKSENKYGAIVELTDKNTGLIKYIFESSDNLFSKIQKEIMDKTNIYTTTYQKCSIDKDTGKNLKYNELMIKINEDSNNEISFKYHFLTKSLLNTAKNYKVSISIPEIVEELYKNIFIRAVLERDMSQGDL